MKRNLLSLAVTAAFAVPAVTATAETMFYGRADVAYERYESGSGNTETDQWQVSSQASRLGFKGKEELGDSGLEGFFKMEFQVDLSDDAGDGNFKARNQFVGISGDFGSLILGRHDTPVKTSQGKFDLFGDHAADIKVIVPGEVRASNSAMYTTPRIADAITAKLMIIPGEGNDIDGDGEIDDGFADALSASIAYKADGLYAALAFDDAVVNKVPDPDNAGDTVSVAVDTVRLTGGYKIDNIQLGAIYQTAETSNEIGAGNTKIESNAFLISGAVTANNTKFKAQYGMNEYENDDGDTLFDGQLIAVGVDYILSKNTNLYAEYTDLSDDETSANDNNTLAFGAKHKF